MSEPDDAGVIGELVVDILARSRELFIRRGRRGYRVVVRSRGASQVFDETRAPLSRLLGAAKAWIAANPDPEPPEPEPFAWTRKRPEQDRS